MTQRVHLYDEGALIERLSTGIKKHTQEVIFLVGAPMSAPTEIGGRGVPGVEGIIQLIREEFNDDGAQSAALEEELRNAGASRYQAAFQFLQGRRGQRCCNDIVRKAVLTSRRALINAAEIPPDEACRLMESDLDGWTLTRGTESLGSLIACHPRRFGNALLTTNFDPLIEVAIRRAGGKYFRTILHSDGYLGQTTGEGCHIIHLHGYWYGSDTLHTNLQLQQARPRLKSSLLSLLRNKLVVVSACGGWDDVFMTTLMEIVGDDSSYPDILWTFDTASPNNTDAIVERLEPGIQRGRVTLYTGIDCHHLFARLQNVWATLEPIAMVESVPSNPVRIAALDLNAISTSAQQTHYYTDEDEDTPPFIEICVGRDTELERLRSSGASAVFLTGIGGQGKSTVAAHYFGEDSTAARFPIRIWRDCKGESDRFENQLAAVVEKLSNHRIRANELARQSASTIVSLLAKLINERDVLMVFDNVDHYVDLEAGQFVGGAHALVEGILHSGCGSQAVFTCRPAVIYGQPNALSQRLEGIDLQATKQLFTQRRALSSADEIREAHVATEGHAFWLDLLAIQVAKRAPEVTLPMLIEEIEVGGGPLPDKTLRSIWATLAKREQTVLRAMAETVKPAPAGELAEYLSHLLKYDKVMKALRALRAMNLVVVKRRPRAADQLELHPLVRTLVRQQFSINERVYFINPIINFYLRLVGGKRDQLDQHPSLPVLHHWSQIAELYVASNQFEEAFKQLGDAADAFLSSAYPREFLRVTRILLSKLDWVSEHYRFKSFEIVFHTRVKLLGYLGQYTEAELTLPAKNVSLS